jgi:hypothetical protein
MTEAVAGLMCPVQMKLSLILEATAMALQLTYGKSQSLLRKPEAL